jgi:Uncharacterised nucleotidyltransferase
MFPTPTNDVLLRAVREPGTTRELTLADWNWLLPAARTTGVLNRIATAIVEGGMLDAIHPPIHWHLESAYRDAEYNKRIIAWEIDRLGRVLGDVDFPLVLLKGAAYVASGLGPARGRLSGDVDLLVPLERLNLVEMRLDAAGWVPRDLDPRDASYFRLWLHELPPRVHSYRRVELDVHHSILPRTDRLWVDPRPLFEAAVPVATDSRFHVLAPTDMFLHSAAHLFRNGDFSKGLRDLLDLHGLIGSFSLIPGFWDRLLDRARQLHLRIPCALALRYLSKYLETPIPESIAEHAAGGLPRFPSVSLFDYFVHRALLPCRLDGKDTVRATSHWVLAHYPLPCARAMLTPIFWLKRFPFRVA